MRLYMANQRIAQLERELKMHDWYGELLELREAVQVERRTAQRWQANCMTMTIVACAGWVAFVLMTGAAVLLIGAGGA